LGCAALLAGCDGQDPARLQRIGRLALTKLEVLAGGPDGKLANGWQAVRGGASPDGRVRLRLRWERSLDGSAIQVQTVSPGVVRLQGTVVDGAGRSRAQEIAETTQGVERVENVLEIKGPAAGQ
jgi:hypothetical protein